MILDSSFYTPLIQSIKASCWVYLKNTSRLLPLPTTLTVTDGCTAILLLACYRKSSPGPPSPVYSLFLTKQVKSSYEQIRWFKPHPPPCSPAASPTHWDQSTNSCMLSPTSLPSVHSPPLCSWAAVPQASSPSTCSPSVIIHSPPCFCSVSLFTKFTMATPHFPQSLSLFFP